MARTSSVLCFVAVLMAVVSASSDDVKRYIVGEQEQTVSQDDAEYVRHKFTRDDIEALRTLIQAWEAGEADKQDDKKTSSHHGRGGGSSSSVKQCGMSDVTREERVVGGTEAEQHAWPWQVSLRRTDLDNMHFCGGSVIGERWVVTAAHCVKSEDGSTTSAGKISVVAGAHHKAYDYDEESRQYRNVQRILPNEAYPDKRRDIALLELDEDLEWTTAVAPVCLPQPGNDVKSNTLCTITGWGDTEGTGSDDVLREADVPIMSLGQCTQRGFYHKGEINEYMMCAGRAEGGVDTCQGDSGGPLVCRNEGGAYELHGITSWGDGCAEARKPGVYTRVSSLMSWLDSHMDG